MNQLTRVDEQGIPCIVQRIYPVDEKWVVNYFTGGYIVYLPCDLPSFVNDFEEEHKVGWVECMAVLDWLNNPGKERFCAV